MTTCDCGKLFSRLALATEAGSREWDVIRRLSISSSLNEGGDVPETIEKQIPILVEWSRDDAATGGERYRLWDAGHSIPSPRAGVIRAEILIDGTWEEMSFNTVWGKQFDKRKQGTWLKQKATRHFTSETGTHDFHVRYVVADG